MTNVIEKLRKEFTDEEIIHILEVAYHGLQHNKSLILQYMGITEKAMAPVIRKLREFLNAK